MQTTQDKTGDSRQAPAHPNTNLNISPIVQDLLLKRGFDQEQILEFFSWDLKKLPKLTELKDIEIAAENIISCITENRLIGIYGDYDVDGTTSCALFYHFFKNIGVSVKLYQPSRFVQGYGLHPCSIETAKEDGVSTLITVDCGITSFDAATKAKEVGIDLIVTDHHKDAKEKRPEALAIVNPNRSDEPEDLPHRKLAGVAVAFCLCLQIKQDLAAMGKETPSLYPLLQFVAVGTLSDLAELTPINLKLVRHGLKQLPKSQYAGLKAFLGPEERNLDFLPSDKISFQIGPMINSKGRLDHPERALLLLQSEDPTEAFNHVSHLEVCNSQRKKIQKEVFQQANEQILKNPDLHQMPIHIVYQPDWHEGVIGIVASKLVETFKVPAIVLTDAEDEGIIKGSARTAGTLSLFEQLALQSDLFLKFGGHHAAAGLSMKKENLELFKLNMQKQLLDIPESLRTTIDHFDMEISSKSITPQLVRELEKMEPFGRGNERPLFKCNDLLIDSFKILKNSHLKWFFSSPHHTRKLQGISFFYMDKVDVHPPEQLYRKQSENELSIIFDLGINRFRGNEFLQLGVKKIEFI